MSDTRSRILEVAEDMVRSGGYNGFSFREIASSIGIKSSSVHHHFPTKEALTLEVARQYHENFFASLGEPLQTKSDSKARLRHYCGVFRSAFESSGRACLCGILSNEAEQLPESVRKVIVDFVRANVSWLEQVLEQDYEDGMARERAELVYCALEGAMGVASLQQDLSWIDRIYKSVSL
ncbi:MAG: TetR/AcrR family transcriptional regulator [Verrucomicrobiota bacterium]